MRVISMVPSWTETLLECGVKVVGRTRFCIHPAGKVKDIPVVGGTKEIDWDKVKSLNADLLLLDQEENPKSFATESPLPWLATHVTDLNSMAEGLEQIAGRLGSAAVANLADRTRICLAKKKSPVSSPAILRRWGEWDPARDEVVYVIWKKPWMAVGPATFIADLLRESGFRLKTLPAGKYPEIPEDLIRESVCLFSSEPFPFARRVDEVQNLCPRGALVDGESFSWFGLRALRYLETLGKQTKV